MSKKHVKPDSAIRDQSCLQGDADKPNLVLLVASLVWNGSTGSLWWTLSMVRREKLHRSYIWWKGEFRAGSHSWYKTQELCIFIWMCRWSFPVTLPSPCWTGSQLKAWFDQNSFQWEGFIFPYAHNYPLCVMLCLFKFPAHSAWQPCNTPVINLYYIERECGKMQNIYICDLMNYVQSQSQHYGNLFIW